MSAIPWGAIDAEIRPLVRLLNDRPGLRTLYSCAGHAEGEEAYVTFTACCQGALNALLAALPFHGARSALVANRFEYRTLVVAARIDLNGHLVYDVRVGGNPQYIQRQLLGEVERALAEATSFSCPLEPTHPLCPRCASRHTRDTGTNYRKGSLMGFDDIRAVTFECKDENCGLRVTVPADKVNPDAVSACPNCRRVWVASRTTTMGGFLAVLPRLIDSTKSNSDISTGVRVLFEFEEPK